MRIFLAVIGVAILIGLIQEYYDSAQEIFQGLNLSWVWILAGIASAYFVVAQIAGGVGHVRNPGRGAQHLVSLTVVLGIAFILALAILGKAGVEDKFQQLRAWSLSEGDTPSGSSAQPAVKPKWVSYTAPAAGEPPVRIQYAGKFLCLGTPQGTPASLISFRDGTTTKGVDDVMLVNSKTSSPLPVLAMLLNSKAEAAGIAGCGQR